MAEIPCMEVIDREHYPIDKPDSPVRAAVIASTRESLRQDGCAVIRGFFSSAGLRALRDEALARVDQAYYSANTACNVYLGDGNPERADDHPQNIFLERTNGFVPADTYSAETLSRRLYAWPPLKDFIADCLGKDELFIYEDPVSNMIVNVCRPGEQFNWHFDTNEFTITMLLQSAQAGGCFEYVANLRNPADECYAAVKRVLDGDRSGVKRLRLEAGDLQLFLGRFSLHRVTRNSGGQDRLVLIMSFAQRAGMVGNRVRVRDLYGRTAAIHEDETEQPVRADGLLD